MTHKDPHYQLQNNIINKAWYVNPYDQDQIRFRDHDIRYVERAVVVCGLELEFPPQCQEALLENIEHSPHFHELEVFTPCFDMEQTKLESYWRFTLGDELYDKVIERNIFLKPGSFPWNFVTYSHSLLGGTDIDQHSLWKLSEDVSKITKSYLSYNGRAKDHRTDLVDALRQNKLWDKGHLSYAWSQYQSDPPIEADWIHSTDLLPTDGSDKIDPECINSYCLTTEFLESFCHVVTESFCDDEPESDLRRMFITEKTCMPIWFMRPFMVLTTPGYHNLLAERCGLELYTEIIDYDFDTRVDRRERIVGIIKNIKRIESRRAEWPEMFEQIRPKLERNRARLAEIATDISEFPHALADQILDGHHSITTSMLGYWEHTKIICENIVPNNVYSIEYESDEHRDKFISYCDTILPLNPEWVADPLIHHMGNREWEPHMEQDFIVQLNDRNIKVKSYWFSTQEFLDGLDNQSEITQVRNLELISDPFHHATCDYSNYLSMSDSIEKPEDHPGFMYFGTCLLARPHCHRVYVLENLYRELGGTSQIQTWHEVKVGYNGPSYKQELCHYLTDPNISELRNIFKFIEYDNWDDHMDSFKPRHDYQEALFDFVTESSTRDYLYTEKIFKPIASKKPFVLLGCQNSVKFLADNYDIQPYDEVVDYSYDSIPDEFDRARAYTLEMIRISQLGLERMEELYDTMWPKIKHNYEVWHNYITQGRFPKDLEEMYIKQYEQSKQYKYNIHLLHTGYNQDNENFIKRVEHCIKHQNI